MNATAPAMPALCINCAAEGRCMKRQAMCAYTLANRGTPANEPMAKWHILKGTARVSGDGFKDTTVKGEVVFVWNCEKPEPYAPGQYPRLNNIGWSASRSMFDFEPATVEEAMRWVEEAEEYKTRLHLHQAVQVQSETVMANAQVRAWMDAHAVTKCELRAAQDFIRRGGSEEERAQVLALAGASPNGSPPANSRFGFDSDPAVDFWCEVSAIAAEKLRMPPGMQPELLAKLRARIQRALEFRVGGTPLGVEAKARLRAIAAAVGEPQQRFDAAVSLRSGVDTCACFPGVCRGGEVINGKLANGQQCMEACGGWGIDSTGALRAVAPADEGPIETSEGEALPYVHPPTHELPASATVPKLSHLTVAQLLALAAQDNDAASCFQNGADEDDSTAMVIVVKGADEKNAVMGMLISAGYLTPGAPVSDPVDEWARDDEATYSLLMLVGGHDVPREVISTWTDEQCQQAGDWAAREHLHASDNDEVERVPMPEHVKAHPPKPFTGDGLDLWSN